MYLVTLAAVVVTLGCVVIAVVLNNIWARLALVEVVYNEGLPPGFATTDKLSQSRLREIIGGGLSIFLSRHCQGCRRLLDELDNLSAGEVLDDVTFYFVDEPDAHLLARITKFGSKVEIDQEDLSQRIGVGPLPYALALGPYSLADQATVAHLDALREICANAGLANLATPSYLSEPAV